MSIKCQYALWLLLLCLLSNQSTLQAQANGILEIVKVTDIQFDGVIDEGAWEAITPVPLVQYSPNAGEPPTEKTEIRFAYDETYFYASIRAFDSDASGIRGNSLYRDRLGGSDHFEILLDTYNDNESAFIFNTISTGVRTDAAVSNDATGGTISSSSWFNGSFNTFWDTKVSRDDEGWYAETRIPFSSLRFQNIKGDVRMGLIVQRKIARKLERLVYPNIPPENNWAFLKPSLAQKILIKGIQPTKSVYITPYVIASTEKRNMLTENGQSYLADRNQSYDIGGDIKLSVTNNLTLDFTINTDFAQVEADDQLINLSRFSLFFPEKRQFFQEKADVFDFKTGGLSRVFFSRRIGLTGSGEAVPIWGGARMVGRIKSWDIGLLNMQTRHFEDLSSENFGVIRVKRRILNENSTIGGIFTSRIGTNGDNNITYGIDGLFRIKNFDFLTANWSQSFQSIDPESASFSHSGRLTLELNRRLRNKFGYNIGAIYSGKNYEPGIGFVDRSNFKFATANGSYTWIYPEGTTYIFQSLDIGSLLYIDNTTDQVQSAELSTAWSASNRTQDNFKLGFKWLYENLELPFSLSRNVEIPIGDYKFTRLSGSYSMAGEKLIRTRVSVETGTFYDGWLHTLSIQPSWFVSKHLELSLQYSYNKGHFSDRNEALDIHITRLRIGTAFNTKASINSFIQYSSEANLITANFRFRYNFKEGSDLWLVFNEGLHTDRFSRFPTLPRVNAESFAIKYLHTFQIPNL